jgi:beta-N-acetylhexosaminidase
MEDHVNIYLRKRSRSSSGTLLVTFVLGFAIGFFVAYAVFGGSPQSFFIPAAPPAADAPAAEQAVEAIPQPASPIEPPPMPIAEAPAPAPEMWPGRFIMIAAPETIDEAAAVFLAEIKPGAVLLRDTHTRDPKRTLETVASIKAAAGFGRAVSDLPLIAIEQEGGKINPLNLETAPAAAELAKSGDTEAARLLGQATAQAALPRGIGIVLAPVLSVIPKGIKNDAMKDRVFGSDQELVANMGLAFADGMALGGAISVAKYYPGVGIAKNQGAGLQVLDAESPKLAELMYPFWEAATAGLPGILAGHVAVPSLDLLQPGRPASMSPVLIRRILRNDWKYNGVILADDACSSELAATAEPGKAAVDALAAGCDAVLALDTDFDAVRAVCAAIQKAIDDQILSREALIESRKRLESWQNQLAGYGVPQDQPSVELDGEKDTPAQPAPEPEPEQPPAAPGLLEPAPAQPPAPETPVPTDTLPEQPPAPEPPAPAETPPADAAPTQLPPEEPAAPTESAPTPPEPVAPVEPAPPSQTAEPDPAADGQLVEIVHIIQPGEMLSRIAASYGVKQSDIVKWNNLKNANIKYGYKLKIYRPVSAPPLTPAPDSPPQSEPAPPPEQQPTPETPAPEPPAPETPATEQPQPADADADQPDQTTGLLANRRKYEVKPGDTLGSIAQTLGIDPKLIMAWNGLENENVTEGQMLIVFASGAAAAPAADQEGSYTVCEGDNAYRVAKKFNADVNTLLKMNPHIKNADLLVVGQRIAVPKKQ